MQRFSLILALCLIAGCAAPATTVTVKPVAKGSTQPAPPMVVAPSVGVPTTDHLISNDGGGLVAEAGGSNQIKAQVHQPGGTGAWTAPSASPSATPTPGTSR